MDNITINDTDILELIQQLTNKVHQVIGSLTKKMNDINNKTSPLPESNYENAYNLIENVRERNRNYLDISTEIHRENTNLIERVNTLDKLLDDFELVLNQNKLKFGLQGLIKKNFKEKIEKDEEIGEPELDILNAPYSVTPFEPQSIGGKNIKRKSKKSRHRKIKRRTKRRN